MFLLYKVLEVFVNYILKIIISIIFLIKNLIFRSLRKLNIFLKKIRNFIYCLMSMTPCHLPHRCHVIITYTPWHSHVIKTSSFPWQRYHKCESILALHNKNANLYTTTLCFVFQNLCTSTFAHE